MGLCAMVWPSEPNASASYMHSFASVRKNCLRISLCFDVYSTGTGLSSIRNLSSIQNHFDCLVDGNQTVDVTEETVDATEEK